MDCRTEDRSLVWRNKGTWKNSCETMKQLLKVSAAKELFADNKIIWGSILRNRGRTENLLGNNRTLSKALSEQKKEDPRISDTMSFYTYRLLR